MVDSKQWACVTRAVALLSVVVVTIDCCYSVTGKNFSKLEITLRPASRLPTHEVTPPLCEADSGSMFALATFNFQYVCRLAE